MTHLVAASMLLLSAYALWNIPTQTSGAMRIWSARAVLLVGGTVFGLLSVRFANTDEVSAVTLFLIGFGQVHAPAAIMFFLKARRREGLS